MKPDILHDSPDNRQTAHLCGEGINLIGALSDIAEKALDGIGCLNVAMHGRGKGVKRQQMLFILHQAPYRFGIALSIFGFERIEVGQRILLLLLLPDACELGLDFLSFSSRDGTHDVALLVDQTALTRRCRKQFSDSGEQAVMTIGDQQIHLGSSSCPHILQQAQPACFVLLGTDAQSQHFLLSFQIDA